MSSLSYENKIEYYLWSRIPSGAIHLRQQTYSEFKTHISDIQNIVHFPEYPRNHCYAIIHDSAGVTGEMVDIQMNE